MADAADKQSLESLLRPSGQEHLLAFWEQLGSAERQNLARQLQALDLELIQSLFQGDDHQPDWVELARRAAPPPAVRLSQRLGGSAGALGITSAAAGKRGAEALATGEVGVLLTAGGQGSRLGFDRPKSLYPIGPLSSASLLQVHIEKVRAVVQRHGVAVPLYLMTSPATQAETVRFLADHNNFGLSEADLFVFCQGTMPAVDAQTGKLLLAAKGQLFLSPDGHGGTVAALEKTGALDHMRARGIRQLFYLQVDNPLVPICDAELLGYHLLAQSELTSLAVAKRGPYERLGNFALIDDALHVIEYSDLPNDVAELRDAHGELKFWAGSIAVHVFEVGLLERASHRDDLLPFHIAHKKVSYVDAAGKRIEPEQNNALKFERFIFDLIPSAKRPVIVEYDEQECFAPLKNAPGAEKDTAEYVQNMMLAQHRRWLEEAGATVAKGADVEISPLFALDAAGVAQRVESGQFFAQSTYLSAR